MNTNVGMTARSVRLIDTDELVEMWASRSNSLSPRSRLLICDELMRRGFAWERTPDGSLILTY